jgi:hypothetical protein
MEKVTLQLPSLQEPNSQVVLSFDAQAQTVAVDREVLFRSLVLSNTILEADGSTVCESPGFVRAWLAYLGGADERDSYLLTKVPSCACSASLLHSCACCTPVFVLLAWPDDITSQRPVAPHI